MWPKYPRQARRGPRSRKTAAAMRMSKRAAGKRCGPSRTNASTTVVDASASTEATSSVWRQGSVVRPRTSHGVAEPTVSAPTRIPMARPRPSRNQVAMIFMAGGYAPAMATPVTKRSTSAAGRLSTQRATTPLESAPRTALPAMSSRGDHTSGRLPSALTRVPPMNPSWTAMVSPALPPSPSCHSLRNAGSTAEAENQSDSASNSASDSTASCRQRASTIVAAGLARLDAWAARSRCARLRTLLFAALARLLDDFAGAQGGDVGGAEAEVLEDHVGVLAAERCRRAHAARRVGELDGHAELAYAALGRMLDVDDHLPMVDLRVVDHLLDVIDLAHADVRLHEPLVPVVAIARLDDLLDLVAGGGLLAVGCPHELVRLAREPLEIRPADGLAEVRPQPRLGAADGQQLVVARLVDRVVGIRAAEEALATPRRRAVAEEETHVRRRRQQRDRRVQIRDVDVLAAPGALPREERQRDAERTVQAGAGVIGHEVQRDHRLLAAGLADEPEHAGQREVVHVVGGTVPVRSVLTESG